MMFDRYVDTIECPKCGAMFEASVHDQVGDRLMRVFRPHDLVQEYADHACKLISEDVQCPDCDHEFPVTVHIVRGVVVHFEEEPPDGDDPNAMLEFMDRAILANSQRRGSLEHVVDVVRLALRLWTGDPTLQIGDDWHVEEKGLDRLWKGMPAEEFAARLRRYLDTKVG